MFARAWVARRCGRTTPGLAEDKKLRVIAPREIDQLINFMLASQAGYNDVMRAAQRHNAINLMHWLVGAHGIARTQLVTRIGHRNIPAWNYAIVATKQTSSGPVRLGTTVTQVRSLPTRSEETLVVSEYIDGQRLALEGQLGPFTGVMSYELEETAGGTRLTNTADLQPARGDASSVSAHCPAPSRSCR